MWEIDLGTLHLGYGIRRYSQVTYYLKIVKEEQARSHLVPKQTKPIFLIKVTGRVVYIRGRFKHKFCVR